jgi:hypothetical protein
MTSEISSQLSGALDLERRACAALFAESDTAARIEKFAKEL